MKYQIIGAMKMSFETKKGSKYKAISCMPVEKDDRWVGIPGETITFWNDTLREVVCETASGEWFAKDDKRYFIDIDYNKSGFIVGARIYNG